MTNPSDQFAGAKPMPGTQPWVDEMGRACAIRKSHSYVGERGVACVYRLAASGTWYQQGRANDVDWTCAGGKPGEPPPAKTLRVRILVATDEAQNAAAGTLLPLGRPLVELRSELLGMLDPESGQSIAWTWVEADVFLPEPAGVVQGTVSGEQEEPK